MPALPSPDLELHTDTRADKVRLLYAQGWPPVFFSALNGVFFLVIFDGQVAPALLWGWFWALMAASTVRAVLFLLFQRRQRQPLAAASWERAFFLTLLLPTMVWGLGGLALAMGTTFTYQMVVYFFLMGMAAGAVAVYSSIRYIAATVIAIELVPLTLYFLLAGDTLHRLIGLGCVTFLLATHRAIKVYADTLQQNDDLTAELRQSNAEIRKLASSDFLTGLSNRRAFIETAEHQLAFCQRQGFPVALLVIDLDHFKGINDQHGHLVGDQALTLAAHTLRERLRKSDICGRFGGEEFVALLPNTPADGACHVAEIIREAIAAQQLTVADGTLQFTASIGVAAGSGELNDLISRADQALYEAKRTGRNRVALG